MRFIVRHCVDLKEVNGLSIVHHLDNFPTMACRDKIRDRRVNFIYRQKPLIFSTPMT